MYLLTKMRINLITEMIYRIFVRRHAGIMMGKPAWRVSKCTRKHCNLVNVLFNQFVIHFCYTQCIR